MIGLVLAAGKGKRLKPFTETIPKPLLPVVDKPLVFYSLKLLQELGVEKVVVVVSHLKEIAVRGISEVCERLGLNPVFVYQGEELGTGHAVAKALDHLDDDVVVVYGDLFIDDDARRRIREFLEKGVKNVVCGAMVDDVSRYGKLVVDSGRVMDIVEKPNEKSPGLVNAGIYVFKHSVLELVEQIPRSSRGEYELTDLIRIARGKGEEFHLVELPRDSWIDVGYPWMLLEVNKRVLEKIDRCVKGEVAPNVTIKGPVVIEEGAEIRSGTTIVGPSYVGPNAVIGPNAFIRPYTVIRSEAHIGFSVEVKESIVMERTHAAHLTYIGDSIIGRDVNFGAGTITANLRFDWKTIKVTIEGKRIDSGRVKLGAFVGDNVKTGINVSIMPGVKIGHNSIIYPGVVVYRDVPPNTVVKENWK